MQAIMLIFICISNDQNVIYKLKRLRNENNAKCNSIRNDSSIS